MNDTTEICEYNMWIGKKERKREKEIRKKMTDFSFIV